MTSIRRKLPTSLGHRCRFQVLGQATALPVGRPTLCPLGLNVRDPSDKNIPYSCSSVSSSAWILCEDSDQFGSSWQEPLSVRRALLPSLLSHSVATDRTEIKKETQRFSLQRLCLFRRGVCSTPIILVSVCSLASQAASSIWQPPICSRRQLLSEKQLAAPAALLQERNKAQRTILLSSGWQGNLNYTPKGCGLWKTRKNV